MPRVLWLIACAALTLVSGACSHIPGCEGEHKPTRPSSIRHAAFFGAVTSDPAQWTPYDSHTAARLEVAGRRVDVDSTTQRFGSCWTDLRRVPCFAFVGSTRDRSASWMLFVRYAGPGSPKGTAYAHATIWKIGATSLTLSEGLELPLSRPFAARLHGTDAGRAQLNALEHDDLGAGIRVDTKTGDVVDAAPSGCQ